MRLKIQTNYPRNLRDHPRIGERERSGFHRNKLGRYNAWIFQVCKICALSLLTYNNLPIQDVSYRKIQVCRGYSALLACKDMKIGCRPDSNRGLGRQNVLGRRLNCSIVLAAINTRHEECGRAIISPARNKRKTILL